MDSTHASHIVGIHHIGIVVDDIRTKSKIYQEKLGYVPESGIIHEVTQKVYVQFLILGNYRIELIQPVREESPVFKFLSTGGGLNHICYESDDIEMTKQFLRKEYGALCVSDEWSKSIKNCKVAFFAKSNGEVLEIIQPFKGTKYFTALGNEKDINLSL